MSTRGTTETSRLRAAATAVHRWLTPAHLTAEGTTPDYRFSLANERTYLAWLRTALALIGGGLAVTHFLPDLHQVLRAFLAALLLFGGAACAIYAVRHWTTCERAIRHGRDLSLSRFPTLLAVALTLAATVILILTATDQLPA